MKISKKVTLFMVLVLVLVSFVGCAKDTQGNTEQGETQEEVKVVTTYMPATDLVLALSGKDNLVGVDDASIKSDVIKKLEPKHELVGVGSKKNGINIEQVLSLDPDLVVLYPVDSSDEILTQLQDKGIEVISINPESLESLQEDVLAVGKAMGKEDLAKELNKYINDKISMVEERVKDIQDKKTVYLAGSRGVLSTHSGDFYQHELIVRAGGEDLSKDLVGGWNEISAEQVIKWNPDVITTVNYSPDNVDSIMENKSLGGIKAIEEGRVYEIPSNIESWDMPKPSSFLGIMWMGKTLYPEKFEDMDLTKEANDFYNKFYGKSFEDIGGSNLEGGQQSEK